MYIAFDIGGSFIKIAKLDEKGNILDKSKVETPKEYDEFLDIITKNIQNDNYEGVCFSCPGSVNKKTGKITGTSAIPYIHENNFAKYIKDKYLINVSIENDANCSALGQIYFNNIKYDIVVFLTIGTGIGGAIVYKGKLISGKNNEVGEFGYMKLGSDDNLSKLSTLHNISRKIYENENIEIGTYDLLDKYYEKISPYYEYVEQGFKYLQMAIYNIKYFIDPDIILIGGQISSDSRYIDTIQKNSPYVKIRSCKNFNDSNILGALANHLQGEII